MLLAHRIKYREKRMNGQFTVWLSLDETTVGICGICRSFVVLKFIST